MDTDKPAIQDTCAAAATSNTRDGTWDWILKIESGVKDVHQVLWPSGPGGLWSAKLTTGMDSKDAPMFQCTDEDWRNALTSGNVERYQQFLAGRGLHLSDNPLEATSEHGFAPFQA